MRFMMFIYPRIEDEAGWVPEEKSIGPIMKYNEELIRAGVLLALDAFLPPSQGARIRFAGGKHQVVDGPFAQTKEVISGYWLLQVKSREEAIAWAARCPLEEGQDLELRRIFEMSDFSAGAAEYIHSRPGRAQPGLASRP